ncbi:predicted protein [Nematostella vectensis]|uniref:Iron-sulfur cluster co-chaperone protein HscB n=1 Tax=Nematostella vectensis TaxID=45351 RepID=A7RMA9_NEMVE|nr:predicted protein [Nematostella vectensis]|eukprot:XP_001639535.1 predicted protein [Nematostella vectensis]
MAASFALFCRQCFYQSPRLYTRRITTNRYYYNRSLRSGSVRLLSSVCTKECCCSRPRTCWKCHSNLFGHADFFCPSCDVIQPPEGDANYFEIMDRPEGFRIDTEVLTKDYRDLQMKLHPDRFSLQAEEEQNFSALQSSVVNQAYRTLLKPLSRGLYLLKIHGESIEEGDISSCNAKFLMEIMEINEKIEDASNDKNIQVIEDENNAKIQRCTHDVAEAFEEGNIMAAKEHLCKLKYYTNISNQIKDRKASLLLSGDH